MAQEYNFYTTDESFDYNGPFGTATQYETGYHGFSIEVDKNDIIDITSLDAYGDYTEMQDKCKTLEDLKKYLEEHLDEVQEDEEKHRYTNRECFEELIEIINDNIKAAA